MPHFVSSSTIFYFCKHVFYQEGLNQFVRRVRHSGVFWLNANKTPSLYFGQLLTTFFPLNGYKSLCSIKPFFLVDPIVNSWSVGLFNECFLWVKYGSN